jgi:hypothetical protein
VHLGKGKLAHADLGALGPFGLTPA